jgi:transcriptional regulator with XRE-family HTH domain
MVVNNLEREVYLHKRRAEIGQRVKEIRRRSGWSQENVARHLGCSRIKVNRAENGGTEFSVVELELMARLFDVTILQFLDISLSISIDGDDRKYPIPG